MALKRHPQPPTEEECPTVGLRSEQGNMINSTEHKCIRGLWTPPQAHLPKQSQTGIIGLASITSHPLVRSPSSHKLIWKFCARCSWTVPQDLQDISESKSESSIGAGSACRMRTWTWQRPTGSSSSRPRPHLQPMGRSKISAGGLEVLQTRP